MKDFNFDKDYEINEEYKEKKDAKEFAEKEKALATQAYKFIFHWEEPINLLTELIEILGWGLNKAILFSLESIKITFNSAKEGPIGTLILPVNYTARQLHEFLPTLDINVRNIKSYEIVIKDKGWNEYNSDEKEWVYHPSKPIHLEE